MDSHTATEIPHFVGPAAAFSAAVIWSVAATIYSRVSERAHATTVNATRALIGIVLNGLFAICYFGPGEFLADFGAVQSSTVLWYSVSMVAGLAFGDVLFFKSCTMLGVPSAMVIGSTYPLWAAIAGFLFLGQALTARNVFGLLLAVFGVGTVILADRSRFAAGGSGDTAVRTQYIKGLGFGLVTSLLWALNTFATTKGSIGLSVSAGITLRLAIGFVFCQIAGAIATGKPAGLVPWSVFRPVYWVFAIEGFLGTTSFLVGMKYSSLAVGATLTSISPVLAALIARFYYGQPISMQKLAGIVVVVTGIVLLVT